jgi:oxygen-independent coproporphyrinogen-3 oxidase
LAVFKRANINRLSIGTQSFYNRELELMNRSHNAEEAKSSIMRAQDAGFENITIDLIFGMPGSTLASWQDNVNTALALQIPHLSAYSLTVEPKTALHKMIESGKLILPNEAVSLAQYEALCTLTKAAGFTHYELSNYSKPGFESKHNTSYWNGTPYLGIGPSAHIFDGQTRQWNVANNTQYSVQISAQKEWFEVEKISEKERFNEVVMTGLRTAKGVSLSAIESAFGAEVADNLLADAAAKLECGKLLLVGDVLTIPEKHWMLSDSIISDLFWV